MLKLVRTLSPEISSFLMNAVATSRGRVLSSQQVRFSDAPVRLGQKSGCRTEAANVSVRTDPETGDIVAIVVQCGCGEVTVVECNYGAISVEASDG